jgi:hypothetical protein
MARSAFALHREAGYMNATGHLHHHLAALRTGAGSIHEPLAKCQAGICQLHVWPNRSQTKTTVIGMVDAGPFV